MKKVYIVNAVRTPIGRMGGALSSVSAVSLGALVIKEALRRGGVPAEAVDHVYMGCVIQAGLGQNAARQAALQAGLPVTATAETLNIVCGSGLDAVNAAARMIACGDADIVAAGGMENMSQAPFAMMQGRFGYRMGAPMGKSELVDTMVHDALWDAIQDYHMGITAENVAEKWGITREELDAFAAASQQKAVRSQETGVFQEEIVPVTVKVKKKEVLVDTDEGPRPETTVESLAGLRPAFRPDGIVTAGNSSGINDGAAAIILASEEKVKELGLEPMAQWLGGALGGTDPAIMGVGPVESTRKLLGKLNMNMEDMDLIEANEAFAAQSIAVQRELGIPEEKLNIGGGAIALGHPVGASGARILTTLLYHLKRTGGKKGLATLCIGGGMGCSCIVERVEK
ncbi:MAG: acetyl-CoA C-acetyltransferase [Dorea sp.]|nr:acetyl-CoA C-acetyltransferase [Dorea sp.]